MSNVDKTLTEEELQDITGTDSKLRQKRILSKNGIHFIEGHNGHVCTTWYKVNHPINFAPANDEGANWDALEDGKKA